MIVIDTHIWVWWVHGDPHLTDLHFGVLDDPSIDGIGVSVISCWEVAMLASRGRLALCVPVEEWISLALNVAKVRLIDLTPRIAIESTQLPSDFHRDPADRIIVATARVYDCPLFSLDARIQAYTHVKHVVTPVE